MTKGVFIMKACGKVHKYGDNVDTDVIIPARYLNTPDMQELAQHCMEDIDVDFAKNVQKGDIMVAKSNFGCGSSREHAPAAIKASGISCVIAKTFARIFYRNAINIGLPIIECEEAAEKIDNGDEVEIVALSQTRPRMRLIRVSHSLSFLSISSTAMVFLTHLNKIF